MKALESSDAAVIEVGLGVAIAADPDFVPPYRLLAQIKAQRRIAPVPSPRSTRRWHAAMPSLNWIAPAWNWNPPN